MHHLLTKLLTSDSFFSADLMDKDIRAVAATLSCAVDASISGSSIVTMLAIGSVMVPALLQAMQPLVAGAPAALLAEYQSLHQLLRQNASQVAAATIAEVMAS